MLIPIDVLCSCVSLGLIVMADATATATGFAFYSACFLAGCLLGQFLRLLLLSNDQFSHANLHNAPLSSHMKCLTFLNRLLGLKVAAIKTQQQQHWKRLAKMGNSPELNHDLSTILTQAQLAKSYEIFSFQTRHNVKRKKSCKFSSARLIPSPKAMWGRGSK